MFDANNVEHPEMLLIPPICDSHGRLAPAQYPDLRPRRGHLLGGQQVRPTSPSRKIYSEAIDAIATKVRLGSMYTAAAHSAAHTLMVQAVRQCALGARPNDDYQIAFSHSTPSRPITVDCGATDA